MGQDISTVGGFMRQSRIQAIVLAALISLGAASAARANFVLGSFEGNSADGFGTWNGSAVVPFASDTTGSAYSYSSYGATDGSVALDVTNPASYEQDLAYDFGVNGDIAQFMSNDVLSFTATAPAAGAATAGYWQVYQVFLNGQGGSFSNVASSTPVVNQYYYSGFGGATFNISINYDAYKATLASNPSYLQMIIATNTGGGAPGDLYFDNFQLSQVPEPASFSILGLAAAGLLSRRRRH
jgi:PEP-CTERM motif